MRREECIEESRRESSAETFYRTFDAQLRDFYRILQNLSSALAPYSDHVPEPVCKYITAQVRGDLGKYGIKAGFDDNQPRGPDGCWISGGIGKPPGKGELYIDDAVAYLNEHAKPEPPPKGKGQCATYVREAIEKGGVDLVGHPIPAYQYALPLEGEKVPYLDKFFNRVTPEEMARYWPQKGDIAVFQPLPGHPKGHIQMYNGKRWVSDFKQPGFWPGEDYRKHQPSYVIYRPKYRKKPKPF